MHHEVKGGIKPFFSCLAMAACLLLNSGCAPGQTGIAAEVSPKLDSLLLVLKDVQVKQDFMAKKLGFSLAADTLPREIPLEGSPFLGPEDAKVTLVEFTDLECPYCVKFQPVLDSLAARFPRDLRIVTKHFPLMMHSRAMPASAASIAADYQGRFHAYRKALAPHFRNLADSVLLSAAIQAGLDTARFRKDAVLEPEMKKLIGKDIALGNRLGVQGTPWIFIQGRPVTVRTLEELSEKVAAQIQGAKPVRMGYATGEAQP